jgi:hypothetical protein
MDPTDLIRYSLQKDPRDPKDPTDLIRYSLQKDPRDPKDPKHHGFLLGKT